jgi:hypothetical protein
MAEVVTVVNIKVTVFWGVMKCSLAGRYHSVGGIYCCYLQDTFTAVSHKSHKMCVS